VVNALLSLFREEYADGEVELIDPLAYPTGKVFKTYFAYGAGNAPQKLDALADKNSARRYCLHGNEDIDPHYYHYRK